VAFVCIPAWLQQTLELWTMVSEVRIATLGVSDLERSIAFYRDALAWRLIASGAVDPALAPLLRCTPEHAGRWAVLAADDSGLGRVRLVAFDPPGERLWTEANRYAGSGYYALNFRCRDARASMARIVAAGGHAAHAPSYWEVSEQVAVWDSISDDPDGTRLDLFSYERGGELRGPLHTEVSVLQTVAIATRDIPRSRRFYEGLGFRELFDRVLDFPELQQRQSDEGRQHRPGPGRDVRVPRDRGCARGATRAACPSTALGHPLDRLRQ
jgi:catechol 2,3-dioxygenase-like lactoylglutathione lyase family enzyme